MTYRIFILSLLDKYSFGWGLLLGDLSSSKSFKGMDIWRSTFPDILRAGPLRQQGWSPNSTDSSTKSTRSNVTRRGRYCCENSWLSFSISIIKLEEKEVGRGRDFLFSELLCCSCSREENDDSPCCSSSWLFLPLHAANREHEEWDLDSWFMMGFVLWAKRKNSKLPKRFWNRRSTKLLCDETGLGGESIDWYRIFVANVRPNFSLWIMKPNDERKSNAGLKIWTSNEQWLGRKVPLTPHNSRAVREKGEENKLD